MYKIIVFTHGSLAESLVRTSRLILGSQPDIETYCVEPGCNLEEMKNGVEQSHPALQCFGPGSPGAYRPDVRNAV